MILKLIIFAFTLRSGQLARYQKSTVDSHCCYTSKQLADLFKVNTVKYQAYLSVAKWPSNIIYYDVDPHLEPLLRHYIAEAIDYINGENETCVFWKQRYPDGSEPESRHWVTFTQVEGAASRSMVAITGWNITGQLNTRIYMGFDHAGNTLRRGVLWGKKYPIRTPIDDNNYGRLYLTFILHEMMHVMGFAHEHQRRDRDCYVLVTDYALVTNKKNFAVYPYSFPYSTRFPYDYSSVVHYHEDKYNIRPHNPNHTLGRGDGRLSQLDLWKVNYVYCDKPAYCDLHHNCLQRDYNTHYNTYCFREGIPYNNTQFTCHVPCKVDFPDITNAHKDKEKNPAK